MNSFRKISAFVMMAIIMISLLPMAVFADEPTVIDSGKCGENTIWTLDIKGVLTISGMGEMDDFFEMPEDDEPDYAASNTTPYSEYIWEITEVIVENGVTRIGDGAFIDLFYLKTIILPNTLSSIGDYVFLFCGDMRGEFPLIRGPEGSFAEQYAKDHEMPFKKIFTDISKLTAGPRTAVDWADQVGIVKGYDDGTFRPYEICTRSQMVTMLWRLAGKPAPKSIESASKFPDADGISAGVMKAMAWAVENKIVVGYKDGTFRPKQNVTRQETVIMLWRLAGKPEPETSETYFTDMDGVSPGVLKAVCWACETGIAKGSMQADGTYKFKPNDGCKRHHSATFIYRYSRLY